MSALSVTSSLKSGIKYVQSFLPNSSPDQELAQVAQRVITAKEGLVNGSLANKKKRFHPITGSCTPQLIHDFFNGAFVIFTTLKVAFPHISSLSPVVGLSTGFGFVGAALNLIVGCVVLREGLQAFRNGDMATGIRYLICGIGLLSLAIFMALTSLGAIVSLGGLTTFLLANPWIMPVILLVAMLPLLQEVLKDLISVWRKQDPFSRMQLNKMLELLNKDIVDWNQVRQCLENSELNIDEILKETSSEKALVNRIERLQMTMRPEGAVAAMKVFKAILEQNREVAIESIKSLQHKAKVWKRVQYTRLVQQILFIASFALSIIALRSPSARIFEAVDNGLALGGMVIPIGLDGFFPLLRNTPIIVPAIKEEDLKESVV